MPPRALTPSLRRQVPLRHGGTPGVMPSPTEPWRGCHARRGGSATPWRTASCVLAWIVVPHAAAIAPDAPDAATAATAWVAARSWIDEGAVPAEGSENAAVSLAGVRAVSVILRVGGQVVATSEEFASDPEALRRTMGRAIARLAEHAATNWPPDLAPVLRRQVTLEVDLLGEPESLLGATFSLAAEQVEPGAEGLALRRGDRWFVASPGRLLATNLAGDPERTLRGLAKEAGLPGLELDELVRLDSIGLYRLPATRLAQFRPDADPVEVLRSRPLEPRRGADAALVESMASGLLAHLEASLLRADRPAAEGATEVDSPSGLGLRGDYDPVADRSRPLVAGPLEQAMVVVALARLAAVSPTHAEAARSLAGRLLADLAVVDAVEDPLASSPEALAAVALAASLDSRLAGAAPPALLAQAQNLVRAVALDAAAFESLPAGRRAIVAASLAAMHRGGEDVGTVEEVRARLAAAWRATDPAVRLGLLPWFALADRASPGAIPPQELQVARDRLLEIQIDDPSSDLDGGFDLAEGAVPRADARSLVPATGLAIMLGEARLTPIGGEGSSRDAFRRAASAQRRAIRFLAQLAVREPFEGTWRNPTAARGGVSAATWDARQGVLTEAMATWLLAESIAAGVP